MLSRGFAAVFAAVLATVFSAASAGMFSNFILGGSCYAMGLGSCYGMGLGSFCFHFFVGSGTLRQGLIFLVGMLVGMGQVTFPGFEEVGLLVAPALVCSPALAAAVDAELAQ